MTMTYATLMLLEERKSLKHYEWVITMTSRTPSLPLLQVWTPHDSPLKFSVNWLNTTALNNKIKYEGHHFSGSNDMPRPLRIVSPKRVKPTFAERDITSTEAIPVTKGTKENEDRINIQNALRIGLFEKAANLSLQTMQQNGVSPAPLRIFRSAIDTISSYPMRNDFKVDVELDAPEYIVAGTKLRVKFTYEHLLNPEQDHHELDWIGVYLVGQTQGKDRLIAKANVPEGKQGELVFDGISKDLGTYEIRYCLKGSQCSIGKAGQYQAIYPTVELQCPSNISINGNYEIPVKYKYFLGSNEMQKFDSDTGDFLGVYAVQAPVHDLFGQVDHKKPIKVFHITSCAGIVTFQGIPRFPGKYEIKVCSGMYEDVVLGAFGRLLSMRYQRYRHTEFS